MVSKSPAEKAVPTYTIDVEEAREVLPELLEQALAGAEVVITRDGRPVAKLVAIPEQRQSESGSDKGLGEKADDSGEPDEQIAEFIS
jgi:prevent-host-death family protein